MSPYATLIGTLGRGDGFCERRLLLRIVHRKRSLQQSTALRDAVRRGALRQNGLPQPVMRFIVGRVRLDQRAILLFCQLVALVLDVDRREIETRLGAVR